MQFFANKKDSLQNCFLYCLLNGGLYATKITLWGSLKKNRTLKIKSGQEKRALKGSFFSKWWARQDSNLRPRDYESPALPLRHKPISCDILFNCQFALTALPSSQK